MRPLDAGFVILAIAAVALIGVVAISLVFWRESDIVRNFAILASLAIAVPVGLWRIGVAARQASAAERSAETGVQSQATAQREALDNQLRTGTEMLTSSSLPIRTAGAFLLERLADEHPHEYDDVVWSILRAAGAESEESQDADV